MFDRTLELAVQHVISCLTDLAAEGIVSAPSTHRALQAQPTHELQHGLLRHCPSLPEQHRQDASMPVSASRLCEDLTNGFFEFRVPIRPGEPVAVVVERGPGNLCQVQQQLQPVVGLEVIDRLNFQRRSSCALKARNFPRYATSARNRSFSLRSCSTSLSGTSFPRLTGLRPRFFGRKPSSPSRR